MAYICPECQAIVPSGDHWVKQEGICWGCAIDAADWDPEKHIPLPPMPENYMGPEQYIETDEIPF